MRSQILSFIRFLIAEPLIRDFSCVLVTAGTLHTIQTCMAIKTSVTVNGIACIPDPTDYPQYSPIRVIFTVTSPGRSVIAYAPLVQLVYQASDLPGPQSTFLIDTSTHGNTTVSPISTSLTSTNPQHTSSREIAGTVIGAFLGFGFLIAIICFLLWRRQRHRKPEERNSGVMTKWSKPELHGQPKILCEVDGQCTEELPTETTTRAQELEAQVVPQELSAWNAVRELSDQAVVCETTRGTALQALPSSH